MEVLFAALPNHQIASAHSLPSQSPSWVTLKQYFVVHITWQQKGQRRDASAISGYQGGEMCQMQERIQNLQVSEMGR